MTEHEDLSPIPRNELPPPTAEEADRVMNPTRLDRVVSWLGWWVLELTGALVSAVLAATWPPLLILTVACLLRIGLDPWLHRRRFERQRQRVMARLAVGGDTEDESQVQAELEDEVTEPPTDTEREAG